MTDYKPTHTLIFDADVIGAAVEHWFGDSFKQPTPAIYVKGEEQPRIELESLHSHWQENGEPMTKLDDIKSPVYTREDVQVIGYMDIHRGFALGTDVPVVGRKLAEFMALDVITSQCLYIEEKADHFERLLTKYLRPEVAHNHELHDKISDLFMPIYDQVADFVNGPTFNIHFVSRIGRDVRVEKCGDFRIYDWHKIKGTPYVG